jgi:hypothetical protein
MKSTITIRFTKPQIALAMRAYPNCNLDRLIELSFVFDEAGKIMDCTGTIKDGGNTRHNYAGRGLAYLYETARRKVTARPITAAVLEFPNGQRLRLAGSQASSSGTCRPCPILLAARRRTAGKTDAEVRAAMESLLLGADIDFLQLL